MVSAFLALCDIFKPADRERGQAEGARAPQLPRRADPKQMPLPRRARISVTGKGKT